VQPDVNNDLAMRYLRHLAERLDGAAQVLLGRPVCLYRQQRLIALGSCVEKLLLDVEAEAAVAEQGAESL